jgi:DNA repair protein RecN (Recombination protein N)
MLAQLTISNFAIVRELEIDFHSGMTAITGETGAGKSIAIDALGLCLGGRARATWCAWAQTVPTCAPASP